MLSIRNQLNQNTLQELTNRKNQVLLNIRNLASDVDSQVSTIERADRILVLNTLLKDINIKLNNKDTLEDLEQQRINAFDLANDIIEQNPELLYLTLEEIADQIITREFEEGSMRLIKRSKVIEIISNKLEQFISTILIDISNSTAEDLSLLIEKLSTARELVNSFTKINKYYLDLGLDKEINVEEVLGKQVNFDSFEVRVISDELEGTANSVTDISPRKLSSLLGISARNIQRFIHKIHEEGEEGMEERCFSITHTSTDSRVWRYFTVYGIAEIILRYSKSPESKIQLLREYNPELADKVESQILLIQNQVTEESPLDEDFEIRWKSIKPMVYRDSLSMIFEISREDFTYQTFSEILDFLTTKYNIDKNTSYSTKFRNRIFANRNSMTDSLDILLTKKLSEDDRELPIAEIIGKTDIAGYSGTNFLQYLVSQGCGRFTLNTVYQILNRFSDNYELPKPEHHLLKKLNEIATYTGSAWIRTFLTVRPELINRFFDRVQKAEHKASPVELVNFYTDSSDITDINEWLTKDAEPLVSGQLMEKLDSRTREEIKRALDIISDISRDKGLDSHEILEFIMQDTTFKGQSGMNPYILLLILAIECRENEQFCEFTDELKTQVNSYLK